MTNRALSLLTNIKTADGSREHTIEGIATSPTVDRIGDIIDPHGVISAPTIPLLFNHDPTKIVGLASLDHPTSRGIRFVAKLPKVTTPGALKDRITEVWEMISHKLLGAVSIGFRPISDEPMRGGGIRFRAIEVLELSLVAVPAQPLATITAARSGNAAAQAMVLRSIQAASRRGSNDRAAFNRMVREEYARDPRLAALRARRLGRPEAATLALLGLD